jgi:hypothetical protein
MLYNIIGNVRSGKTLLATILASRVKDRPVYANYHINIPNWKPVQLEDIFNYNNCLLILDEAYAWLEARLSTKDLNRYLSYFLFQSGKRDTDIIITSQYAKSVDIRFRMLSHYVIACRKNDQQQRFEYFVYPNLAGNPFLMCISFKNAEKYFPLYDTREVVYPSEFDALRFKIMLADPNKKSHLLQEILDRARNQIKKITVNEVRVFLIRNKYPTSITNDVYALLKQSGESRTVS